jgi:hypothetical protein
LVMLFRQLTGFDGVSGIGLVYSWIGHQFGYSHSEEVSRCIHKHSP